MNKFNPVFHHRRSYRLTGWDYSSPGYYFLTVCTHNRECLFGQITDKEMYLNEFGKIVQDEWDKSFAIRRELLRDEFVVMPNHIHGIVQLVSVPVMTNGPVAGTHGPVAGTHGPVVGTHGRASPRDGAPPRIGVAYRSPKSVSSFIAGVKSVITKKINEIRNTPGVPVWQPRFHDHLIRDEYELFRIRQYIRNNPVNWDRDNFNGENGNVMREPVAPYGEESWMI